jgi:1-acyl-sn-glycerol-3-phosphate acyltransferase
VAGPPAEQSPDSRRLGADQSADADPATERPATTALAPLPAGGEELRRYLPGLEPDRQLNDWGRSERVESLVDRTLYEFLYHYWFRVEVEGIENVPAEGGALLVANRAGALPTDAAMITKALADEHPRPRSVQLGVRDGLTALPGVGMAVVKLGGVPSHPANLHRLLLDEQQLVLTFPEGPAAGRALGRRYLLRAFDGAFTGVAARAGVPIVPVALVGGDEASPIIGRLGRAAGVAGEGVLGRLGPLGRLARLPLAAPVPLPAKFRIRFLEPVELGDEGDGHLGVLAGEIRALIQENLLEMVSARRSVWLG